MSDAPPSLFPSDSLGTFAWENMRERRLVIVGFFEGAGASTPFDTGTGSSGIEGGGKVDFPSCERDVADTEGDDVSGAGRCVRILLDSLISCRIKEINFEVRRKDLSIDLSPGGQRPACQASSIQ